MLVDKDGLWYSVLKARYGEEGGDLRREYVTLILVAMYDGYP